LHGGRVSQKRVVLFSYRQELHAAGQLFTRSGVAGCTPFRCTVQRLLPRSLWFFAGKHCRSAFDHLFPDGIPAAGINPSSAGSRSELTKPPIKLKRMNTLALKGNWNIIKGKLKQRWAKLTDDDLELIEGKEDELIGRIQKRPGKRAMRSSRPSIMPARAAKVAQSSRTPAAAGPLVRSRL
jgi:uncharacterized protein YjbJ (UPF0337 family)